MEFCGGGGFGGLCWGGVGRVGGWWIEGGVLCRGELGAMVSEEVTVVGSRSKETRGVGVGDCG